jgi:hypothetical protein
LKKIRIKELPSQVFENFLNQKNYQVQAFGKKIKFQEPLVLGISKTSKNFQVLWNLKALGKTWPLFCDYLTFFKQNKMKILVIYKNKVLDFFIITIIYENQVLDFWYSWTGYMVRSLMQFISTHIGNNLHNF